MGEGSEVRVASNKEELYRRLSQSRRLARGANDHLTQSRLLALTLELESQLAAVERRDADAPAAGAAVSSASL
jgi:hypothetical protein